MVSSDDPQYFYDDTYSSNVCSVDRCTPRILQCLCESQSYMIWNEKNTPNNINLKKTKIGFFWGGKGLWWKKVHFGVKKGPFCRFLHPSHPPFGNLGHGPGFMFYLHHHGATPCFLHQHKQIMLDKSKHIKKKRGVLRWVRGEVGIGPLWVKKKSILRAFCTPSPLEILATGLDLCFIYTTVEQPLTQNNHVR